MACLCMCCLIIFCLESKLTAITGDIVCDMLSGEMFLQQVWGRENITAVVADTVRFYWFWCGRVGRGLTAMSTFYVVV